MSSCTLRAPDYPRPLIVLVNQMDKWIFQSISPLIRKLGRRLLSFCGDYANFLYLYGWEKVLKTLRRCQTCTSGGVTAGSESPQRVNFELMPRHWVQLLKKKSFFKYLNFGGHQNKTFEQPRGKRSQSPRDDSAVGHCRRRHQTVKTNETSRLISVGQERAIFNKPGETASWAQKFLKVCMVWKKYIDLSGDGGYNHSAACSR